MKTILVGGDFGNIPKASTIINKMAELTECDLVNGGTIEELKSVDLSLYDLIVWMPNISNEIEKFYPRKKRGSVLICSKVMREGYNATDAVSRIFKMHGNAVISIITDKKPFVFELIDALGNVWTSTNDIKNIVGEIISLYHFTKDSIRLKSERVSNESIDVSEYKEFVELNKLVADKSESMGGRYFGNCSTRCSKMFPSARYDNTHVLVSRRNVDKSRLTTDDLVLTSLNDGVIEYNGVHKPSVDTPIQLSLYEKFNGINYMIHGHYYIQGAMFTEKYFPCGDLREFDELSNVIRKIKGDGGMINLKNHGFLIFAPTLEYLKTLINASVFIKKDAGNEYVYKNNSLCVMCGCRKDGKGYSQAFCDVCWDEDDYYDYYLKMLEDNPPMMSWDRPAEF